MEKKIKKKTRPTKDKTISFRLDPDMIKRFDGIAKESGLTLSVLMRNVCKQWLVFADETMVHAKKPLTITFDNKYVVEGVLLFNINDAPIISAYAGKVSIDLIK